MEPREERFHLPTDAGVTLHAIAWGALDRPPLVLLHGGGANAHWWDQLAPALAEHFHVVALDFRGHGESDFPEEVKVGAFSEDLEALLAHLGAPDARLVGHSMGGHVALDHAARSARTPALALLDVAWRTPRRTGRLARRALGLRRSYATRAEAIERYAFLPAALHAPEELRRAIAEHSVRREADGRFSYRFDPRWFGLPSQPPPPLASVRCPTLVVRGAKSALLSSEGATALVKGIADARLVELAGAGHHVHLDRPAELLAALLGFLPRESHDAAASSA